MLAPAQKTRCTPSSISEFDQLVGVHQHGDSPFADIGDPCKPNLCMFGAFAFGMSFICHCSVSMGFHDARVIYKRIRMLKKNVRHTDARAAIDTLATSTKRLPMNDHNLKCRTFYPVHFSLKMCSAAAAIVLSITAPASSQTAVLPSASGLGSTGGATASCDNLFVPCAGNDFGITPDAGIGLNNGTGFDSGFDSGLGSGALRPDATSGFVIPGDGTDPSGNFYDNGIYGQQRPQQPPGSAGTTVTQPRMTPTRRQEDPPTEFQLFVAGSIGKMLPLFGRQLFLDVPTTFAPLDKGPVTPDYVLGPGDEILLRAWNGINFNLREHISRDGNLFLPHLGDLPVAGLKFSELQPFLSAHIDEEFHKVDLSVSMGQLRSIQVLVVGRARRPGSFTVSSMSTLVNVLFASGGPLPTGSMRKIELRRNGKLVTTLDLYQLLANGDESKDAPLLSGDVIFIPPAGPTVALAGSVSQPAIYELRDGDTLADALRLAGGVTSIAALQRASLERVDQNGNRQVEDIVLNAQSAKTPLMNGDVLRVFQIVPKFDNAVILRGNVSNPGRYAWHEGMRISDLIPNKESLMTRNYWKGHNSLALTDEESIRAQRIEAAAQSSNDGRPAQQSSGTTNAGNNNVNGTEASPRQAQDVQNVALQSPEDGTPNSVNSTGRSIALDAGRPSEEFPRKNDVELSAPAINWDYAVIERRNPRDLNALLKPFNLGRVVLDHDQSEDYLLQPGDVVTVFSQADIRVPQKHQNKIVRLEGEFESAGVYSVEPGENLRDLVKRAGGFTGDAYLFGSSFSRRATRIQQQARLDEYATELEEEIDREAGNKAGSIINPQEAAVAAASIESQRQLVGKLRQMQATGRIVLNINPGSNDVDGIPALPLEDGDVFLVPARPSSISVVGAVYDQNSFIYEPDDKVKDYLQTAGGVTKSGDWNHSFVIRADGSVVSHSSILAHESHGLERFSLNPGDALVVPEQLNKTTLMRGLTDWSQIFAQFGLGAAAINVLH